MCDCLLALCVQYVYMLGRGFERSVKFAFAGNSDP